MDSPKDIGAQVNVNVGGVQSKLSWPMKPINRFMAHPIQKQPVFDDWTSWEAYFTQFKIEVGKGAGDHCLSQFAIRLFSLSITCGSAAPNETVKSCLTSNS